MASKAKSKGVKVSKDEPVVEEKRVPKTLKELHALRAEEEKAKYEAMVSNFRKLTTPKGKDNE